MSILSKLTELPRLTNAEYHASDGISKSMLDVVRQSPAHYHYRYLSGEYQSKTTPTLEFGSMVHSYVLEFDKFFAEYTRVPDNAPRRPTTAQLTAKKPSDKTLEAIAWWEQFDAENKGRKIVDNEELATLHAIRASILSNKTARKLLENGIAESSVYFTEPETETPCRVRPDWYSSRDFIVDLKTTASAAPRAFGFSAAKYRYHVQAALYMDAFYHSFGEYPAGFVFIAVEKEPPYICACYLATPAMLDAGGNAYLQDLRRIKECQESGIWPAYGDGLMDMLFPNYKNNDDDNQ